LVTCETVWESL
ncbi:hypothetical protein A2U01_0002051, partial [Trifolium medium]|nr:hypothetical protein [Trifolium medium]